MFATPVGRRMNVKYPEQLTLLRRTGTLLAQLYGSILSTMFHAHAFRTLKGHLSGVVAFFFAITATAQEKWPVRFTSAGADYQVFAPQPETMNGDHFTSRSAVALQRAQDKQPLFGAIWGEGVMEVDRTSRLGKLTRFTVSDARFPNLTDAAELAAIKQAISTELPVHCGPISIDWLVSALEEEKRSDNGFSNDPPEIIYTETPSALVFIDGAPRYETMSATMATDGDPVYATGSTSIQRVSNTPFLIVRPEGGDHYLYGSGLWFRAGSINGPWAEEKNVPVELRNIASEVDSTAAITASDDQRIVPAIIVRTAPAELLDLDGAPRMEPVQNTSLLYATNTDKNLFLDINSQAYYLLASGRWFSTRDPRNGPWTFVPSNKLPEAFASIPEGSKRDDVLAHISGTDAAREAVRDASIPQTAQVDRRSATANVTYQGDPAFEQIAGTDVYYARNASTNVLRIKGRFYVCDNAVWFEGPTPDGPWTVSTEVPADVGTIPPSNQMYNLRYVYIYDHTPDVVYVGYTPGYLGAYVQDGCVIYGTGYYYRPWGPYWYPRPFTWGFGMYYDPWYGWGLSAGWGWNWYYPNYWGGWGFRPWGWGWWGPYNYHPYCHVPRYDGHHHYGHRPSMNHRDGRGNGRDGDAFDRGRPADRPQQDLYSTRPMNGVKPSTVERPASLGSGQQKPGHMTSSRPATKPLTQDHFIDARGNVYRRDGDRTQKYDNGTWKPVPRPASGQDTRPGTMVKPPVGDRPADQMRPQPHKDDPIRIQQQRDRGQQRQRDFERARERPQLRVAPTPRVIPRQGGGTVRPSGGQAPSQGGGGNSGGRRKGR